MAGKFKKAWIPTTLLSPESGDAARVTLPVLAPPKPPVKRRSWYIAYHILKWVLGELGRRTLLRFRRKTERSLVAARETREFAERLGGMWIILGRLAALRPDLLGSEYCDELSMLRDRALPSIPFPVVLRMIDEDLKHIGLSADKVFAEIDPQPLATRSFAQLHRGRLKGSGREVALRLRAPDAAERAATDWRWLLRVRRLLGFFNVAPDLRWDDLLFEVKRTTDDLLDFRTEVSELRKIRKILAKRRVYVPAVCRRLCTERLLVTELIRGVSIGDLQRLSMVNPERCDAWLQENSIDRRRVWTRLFNAHHELLFEHNLYYTELPPGSIMLLRDNRIALVPVNTIGTTDGEIQRKYRALAQALLDSEYTKVCDIYLTMGPALPYKDITKMQQSVVRSLRVWETRTHIKYCSYHDKSLASAMGALARCATAQKLPTFWGMARVQIAERTLELSLSFLGPNRNSVRALHRYERGAQLRIIKTALDRKALKRVKNTLNMGALNLQMMENFEHDSDYLRRRLIGAQSKIGRASQVLGRMLLLIGQLATVAGAIQLLVYLHAHHGVDRYIEKQSLIGRLLSTLTVHNRTTSIAIVIVLFLFIRFLRTMARQLFSTEVHPSDTV